MINLCIRCGKPTFLIKSGNNIRGYVPWGLCCHNVRGKKKVNVRPIRSYEEDAGRPDYWNPLDGRPSTLFCPDCRKRKPLIHFSIIADSNVVGRGRRFRICRKCVGIKRARTGREAGLLGGLSTAPDPLGMCIGKKAGEQDYP